MSLEYVNRMDDRYFLLQGTTKTGKPKYYCSLKPKGQQLGAMPEGFEWREKPQNGVVTVRRQPVTRIAAAERAFVEQRVRELAELAAIIVDVEPDALVIYTSNQSREGTERFVEMLSGRPATSEQIDWHLRHSLYSAMLRFGLHDEDDRLFTADRWCFRGSIDGWIFLGGPAALPDLVDKFARHLGEESFFELY